MRRTDCGTRGDTLSKITVRSGRNSMSRTALRCTEGLIPSGAMLGKRLFTVFCATLQEIPL